MPICCTAPFFLRRQCRFRIALHDSSAINGSMTDATRSPDRTRAHWAAFIAAWFGWVLDAFDFTIYLLVMSQIATEFHISTAAVSGSITLTLLLRLGGASVAGWMADRWGRKLPLMLSLVWFAVFDAAIFFAPSF